MSLVDQLKYTFRQVTNRSAVDRYLAALLWLVITMILVWSVRCIYQPITPQQGQHIAAYSTQSLYPNTRQLAWGLKQQAHPVNQYQYFHFLRILYVEKNRIHFQKDEDE